ncbi:MAG: hypothetical protein QM755_02245 [Luteolibacter sp.]
MSTHGCDKGHAVEMKRRQIEQAVHVPAFLLMAGWLIWHGAHDQLGRGLWGLGAYAVFLLLFWWIARSSIPPHKRPTPPLPEEFRGHRLGPLTPALETLLQSGTIINRLRGHTVRRVERKVPEGTWTLDVETSADELIAFCLGFSSAESLTLDKGWSGGVGRIVNNS